MIAVSPHVDEIIEMTSTPGPSGLAELYERHYEAVFRTDLRVTGNPADAEDVLQTVFLRVLSGAEPEASAGRPAAYFRRAAVNAAVDLLRRRAVHAATVYDDQASHAAVESTNHGHARRHGARWSRRRRGLAPASEALLHHTPPATDNRSAYFSNLVQSSTTAIGAVELPSRFMNRKR